MGWMMNRFLTSYEPRLNRNYETNPRPPIWFAQRRPEDAQLFARDGRRSKPHGKLRNEPNTLASGLPREGGGRTTLCPRRLPLKTAREITKRTQDFRSGLPKAGQRGAQLLARDGRCSRPYGKLRNEPKISDPGLLSSESTLVVLLFQLFLDTRECTENEPLLVG